MESFKLGTPALVCRWRIAQKSLPLENRHLRALAARSVNGEPVAQALVAWAKQHVEWTLEDGAREHPDGVLMLTIDEEGRAVMTVGGYYPLKKFLAKDLLVRAQGSWREAERTGVSPEDLWVVRGDSLVWCTSPDYRPSGASSLISDLARTLGMPVLHSEELIREFSNGVIEADEVFLVSDEHGVVPAGDCSGARARRFKESYQKLLEAEGLRVRKA